MIQEYNTDAKIKILSKSQLLLCLAFIISTLFNVWLNNKQTQRLNEHKRLLEKQTEVINQQNLYLKYGRNNK